MKEELYSATMDVFPQQTKQYNQLYPFYDGLRENRFTTTKCKKCGKIKWPPRTICPECISDDLEWVDLPTTGTIEIFTVEEVGVPMGFDSPLIHALVRLDGMDFTFFSRIVGADPEKLQEGAKVALKVLEIDRGRISFAFEPV